MLGLVCDRCAVMGFSRMTQRELTLAIESTTRGDRSVAIRRFGKSGWNPSGPCHRLPHQAGSSFRSQAAASSGPSLPCAPIRLG